MALGAGFFVAATLVVLDALVVVVPVLGILLVDDGPAFVAVRVVRVAGAGTPVAGFAVPALLRVVARVAGADRSLMVAVKSRNTRSRGSRFSGDHVTTLPVCFVPPSTIYPPGPKGHFA